MAVTYRIVQFEGESKEISVVPTNWLVDSVNDAKTKCWWPTGYKTEQRIRKAKIEGTAPESDLGKWELFEVSAVLGSKKSYESYQAATRRLSFYEKHPQFSGSEDERGKRRAATTKITTSSSSNSEGEEVENPLDEGAAIEGFLSDLPSMMPPVSAKFVCQMKEPPPQPFELMELGGSRQQDRKTYPTKKFKQALPQPITPTKASGTDEHDLTESLMQTPRGWKSPRKPSRHHDAARIGSPRICDDNQCRPTPSTSSARVVSETPQSNPKLDRIYEFLKIVNRNVLKNTEMLRTLIEGQSLGLQSARIPPCPNPNLFPLKNDEGLAAAEQELSSEDGRRQWADYFRTLPGKTPKQLVHSLLKEMFVDEFSRHFSVEGRGTNREFKKFNIMLLLNEVVFRKFQESTRQDVREGVMSFLKHANTRIKRQDIKNKKA